MPFDGTNYETQDVLLRARERVAVHGWCQGREAVEGRVCLVGALRHAAGANERLFEGAMVALAGPGANPISLALYNDAPGRTKEEIIDFITAICTTSS